MYEDDDRTLFDEVYQLWAGTTGAEKTYWMPVHVGDYGDGLNWDLQAVNPTDDSKTYIGSFKEEKDAEFVAGIHSVIPDVVRRLHDAVDEAVRADERRDELEGWVADLKLENDGLRDQICELERRLDR